MADIDIQRAVHDDLGQLSHDGAAVADSDPRGDAPYRRWVQRIVVGDVLAACVAAVAARAVPIVIGGQDTVVAGEPFRLSDTAVGLIVIVVWPVILGVCGAYDLRTLLVGVEELRRVVRAGVSLVALLGFAFFATNVDLSRGYVTSCVALVVISTGTSRYLVRIRINRAQATGKGHHNVVAVGPADELQRLCEQLAARPNAIDLVAIVADDLEPETELNGILGTVRRLPNRASIRTLLDEGVAIDLLVRAGRPRPDEVWKLARRAHDLGAALAIAPHREDASAHMAVSYVPLGHTPLLFVETPTLKPVARAIKAVFDRAMALVLLLCLTPVLLLIALLVLVRDGRPIVYRQVRVGRDGEQFRCLKFRTMQRDAEAQLADLVGFNEADGPLFKMRRDPRVTKNGAFLRERSLDELPQLFNVLGGSMSIVGPRPPLPTEVATYDEREARRLLVKPGLTGLWQVQGRSDLPWDEGVYLDLLYVEHWSPLLDLAIIARTLRAVLRPSGAY